MSNAAREPVVGNAPDPALRQDFLKGMSFAACTVNVVTTDGAAGRFGVTVSAMSSVSADGPLPTLLVCVHHQSAAAAAIIENGAFCVNVLRDDQSIVSDSFAGRVRHASGDKFACAEWWTGATGVPRVKGGLVAFDCRLQSQQRVGTHHVFIGEVTDIATADGGSPLIYANRAYGTPAPLAAVPSGHSGVFTIGVYHSFAPYLMPAAVATLASEGVADVRVATGTADEVLAGLRSGSSEIAVLYDFGFPTGFSVRRLASLAPYVLLPEAHPLAALPSVGLADLCRYPMVLLDAEPSGPYFRSLFSSAGLEPDIRWFSPSLETVRGLVARGLGYSLLTTKPAASMSYDGSSLVTRRLADDVEPSHLALVTRDGAELSPRAARFAELVTGLFH